MRSRKEGTKGAGMLDWDASKHDAQPERCHDVCPIGRPPLSRPPTGRVCQASMKPSRNQTQAWKSGRLQPSPSIGGLLGPY